MSRQDMGQREGVSRQDMGQRERSISAQSSVQQWGEILPARGEQESGQGWDRQSQSVGNTAPWGDWAGGRRSRQGGGQERSHSMGVQEEQRGVHRRSTDIHGGGQGEHVFTGRVFV